MRNKNLQSITISLVIVFLSLIVLYSTSANAQRMLPDARAVTDCYNNKLKASGKYVNCLLRAERKANRAGVEVSQDDVTHCHENFERRYTRAEARAANQGTECPSHGGLIPYQDTIVGVTSTINSNNDVKALAININQNDLAQIITGSLNLNIAIKVNGVFNVVWRSISAQKVTQNMEFQWSPVFQVYGAKEIVMEGSQVDIETNVVSIALGQDVVFEANDLLGTPVLGNNPNTVVFFNGSEDPVVPALGQLLTLLGGVQAITSIFYDEDPLFGAESVAITPSQEVLIWFEQNTRTGDIITRLPSQLSTTVDFTNESSAVLNFSEMTWSAPEFEQTN